MSENMKWMYDDANFLYSNGHPRGCLALLLCLVDALAAKALPSITNNRKRYCMFLENCLRQAGHDHKWIVGPNDEIGHMAEGVYNYFRCFMVHEADSGETPRRVLQLSYSDSPKESERCRSDGVTMFVNADYLIKQIFEIIDIEMKRHNKAKDVTKD